MSILLQCFRTPKTFGVAVELLLVWKLKGCFLVWTGRNCYFKEQWCRHPCSLHEWVFYHDVYFPVWLLIFVFCCHDPILITFYFQWHFHLVIGQSKEISGFTFPYCCSTSLVFPAKTNQPSASCLQRYTHVQCTWVVMWYAISAELLWTETITGMLLKCLSKLRSF